MNELFIYLIKAALINSIILAFYHFTLRKSNNFHLMRATLLAAMLLPLIFPLIPYPVDLVQNTANLPVISITLPETDILASETESSLLKMTDVPSLLYYGVSLVLFAGMIVSICSIIQKRLRSRVHFTTYGKVELEHTVKSPFSFFSWVFLSPVDLTHPQLDMILKHEFCHVKEKHSFDRLMSGIFRSVLWFSPLAHITSRLLSEVHEYQADLKVVGVFDRSDYSDLILSFYMNPHSSPISNNFSLHIKKRITMINNLNFNRLRYGRILTGLCISLSLVILTSMVTTTNQPITSIDEHVSNSITTSQSGIINDISQLDRDVTPQYKTDPDTILKAKQVRNSQSDQPDSAPQFPGGDKARIEYIVANTPYPEDARKAGVKGTVYVQFVIETTGKVTNVKILKGVSTSIDKVALAAITNMPDWIPARKDNKLVSYEMTMPIKFELSDDKVGKVANDPNAGDLFSKENSIPQKKEGSRVFTVVEVAPEYPGGDDARVAYLNSNIIYPEQARKNGVQGTVYITFVVEPDGSITGAKVLRGVGGGLDEVALDVVKKMSKWTPGKVKGEPVPVQFNMPIKFKLSDDKKAVEGMKQVTGTSKDQTTKVVKKDGSDVYTIVEQKPEYPGGDQERMKYFAKTLKYTDEAIRKKIEGTVYVSFIVQSDGSITNVKLLKGIGGGLDEIALKAVQAMPKWKPGVVDRKNVAVEYNMPAEFRLISKDKGAIMVPKDNSKN